MMFLAAALAKARAARSTECNITEPSASERLGPAAGVLAASTFSCSTNLCASPTVLLDVQGTSRADAVARRGSAAQRPGLLHDCMHVCVMGRPSSQPRAQPVSRSWFAVLVQHVGAGACLLVAARPCFSL
jgi:hypothetical protein